MLWLAPELEEEELLSADHCIVTYAAACCDCLLSGASEHFSIMDYLKRILVKLTLL